MKNLFKEAHKMAKEIKAEYPEVDYKTQFGLCLSFLQEEKGDMKMENDNVNIIEVKKWVCPVCGKEMNGRMAKVIKNGEEDFVLEKHCECGHTEREEEREEDRKEEIRFTKKGFEFIFRNFEWNGELTAEYKITGVKENKDKDGFYFNARYNAPKNAFLFYNVKIQGKKFDGVGLPDDVNMSTIIEKAKERKVMEIQERIKKLDEKYTDEFVLGLSHNSSYGFNLGEYEESTKGKEIAKKLEDKTVADKVENAMKEYQIDVDLGDYTITTYFKIPVEIFENIVNNTSKEVEAMEKAREEEKEAERNTIFAKAKETGEAQILYRWSEPCNDPNEACDIDNIVVYAMPNGKTETVRNHTW